MRGARLLQFNADVDAVDGDEVAATRQFAEHESVGVAFDVLVEPLQFGVGDDGDVAVLGQAAAGRPDVEVPAVRALPC